MDDVRSNTRGLSNEINVTSCSKTSPKIFHHIVISRVTTLEDSIKGMRTGSEGTTVKHRMPNMTK